MFPLAMFGLGVPELLIILAVVLLLFGGSRLAGLGKSTGRALKEFKEETKGLKAGETPPAAGSLGQNPYQTEAGSTFVPSPQSGTPYQQPQPGVTYNQPPQQGVTYNQPPQQGEVHYDAPPQNGQPTNGAQYGQPTNGAQYGQPPQGQPTERDARRDV